MARSNTPSSKTSISMAPFSVSTTAMMSPRARASPGCFSQRTSVPASISAPSAGMRNSVTRLVNQIAGGAGNAGRRRQRGVFEMFRLSDANFSASHASDGTLHFVKHSFRQLRRDFRRVAPASPPFVSNHDMAGLPRGRRDGFQVHRSKRPQIEYLRFD